MQKIFLMAIALLANFAALNTQAATVGDPVCPFLVRDDLSPLGITKDTDFADSDLDWGESPREAPRAKVFSNMCNVKVKTPEGHVEVLLALDSFTGNVTEEQVGRWIKSIEASRDPEDEGTTIIPVGDSVCETGNYELPTEGPDGGIIKVNELYVACDKQVGTRHMTLNIHVPEANKRHLPTPERTKAILDDSIQLMVAAKLNHAI